MFVIVSLNLRLGFFGNLEIYLADRVKLMYVQIPLCDCAVGLLL